MEIVKAYVRINQTAEVICPHCRGLTRISIEDLQKKYRSRISCVCQNDFIAEVDFRDKYRKPVDLPGHYRVGARKESAPGAGPNGMDLPIHNCRIIDLSRNGIGILFVDGREVDEGEVLQLTFKLDTPTATEISLECEVRHVKGTYAGCKILNDNSHLRVYLIDHGVQ
ncbi:MAG: PilZ domain-containing protein [Proteobacteria bacterium]|nr:PilZ domain-containing protein [Pseudomonadota bacterium]MBU1738845.1 PilZ domain-containing protein [Pseudomonadota bacterium]